jgi:hypothetical protein
MITLKFRTKETIVNFFGKVKNKKYLNINLNLELPSFSKILLIILSSVVIWSVWVIGVKALINNI